MTAAPKNGRTSKPKPPTVQSLKVLVQVVCVVDRGNGLEEVPTNPVAIPASQWADAAPSLLTDAEKAVRDALAADS